MSAAPRPKRVLPDCPPLDFAWADRRWRDPLTGVEVVRLSPPAKRHYQPNFRTVTAINGLFGLFFPVFELSLLSTRQNSD
jgi:hypothetical protein